MRNIQTKNIKTLFCVSEHKSEENSRSGGKITFHLGKRKHIIDLHHKIHLRSHCKLNSHERGSQAEAEISEGHRTVFRHKVISGIFQNDGI